MAALWHVRVVEKPVKGHVWSHGYVVLANSEAQAIARGRFEHAHDIPEYETKVAHVLADLWDGYTVKISARSRRVRPEEK